MSEFAPSCGLRSKRSVSKLSGNGQWSYERFDEPSSNCWTATFWFEVVSTGSSTVRESVSLKVELMADVSEFSSSNPSGRSRLLWSFVQKVELADTGRVWALLSWPVCKLSWESCLTHKPISSSLPPQWSLFCPGWDEVGTISASITWSARYIPKASPCASWRSVNNRSLRRSPTPRISLSSADSRALLKHRGISVRRYCSYLPNSSRSGLWGPFSCPSRIASKSRRLRISI